MTCEQSVWGPMHGCPNYGLHAEWNLCAFVGHSISPGHDHMDEKSPAELFGDERLWWAHDHPERQRDRWTLYDLRCRPCCIHALTSLVVVGDSTCKRLRPEDGFSNVFSDAVKRSWKIHQQMLKREIVDDPMLEFHRHAHSEEYA